MSRTRWVSLTAIPNNIAPALCAVLLFLVVPHVGADQDEKSASRLAAREIGLRRLVQAYPKLLCGNHNNTLVWCDGTKTAFDDGKAKSFEEMLAFADLEDQMSMSYPLSGSAVHPRNFDPGRIRCLSFFKKMYGATKEQVRANLGKVIWLPGVANKKVAVTTVNGVDQKLSAVSKEILQLDRRLIAKVKRTGGAYVWRDIAGTYQPSPHSFGIAIDVGVNIARYWRWGNVDFRKTVRSADSFPLEVVRIFERHGFIWGGKWYHYDTMHFEYRPELAPVPNSGLARTD